MTIKPRPVLKSINEENGVKLSFLLEESDDDGVVRVQPFSPSNRIGADADTHVAEMSGRIRVSTDFLHVPSSYGLLGRALTSGVLCF